MSGQQAQQNDNAEWMVVYETYDEVDAHIVRGRLKSEDIPAFVQKKESYGSTLGLSVGDMGRVVVLVSPRHYQRAVDLLDDEPSFAALDFDALVDDTYTDDE